MAATSDPLIPESSFSRANDCHSIDVSILSALGVGSNIPRSYLARQCDSCPLGSALIP
jgi:hypothetical protein